MRGPDHVNLETDAIADANKALELNPSSKAFRCKGIACFQLEEYETAKAAFSAGANLEPSNSEFRNWLKKCDDAIAAESQLEEGFSGSRDNEQHVNGQGTVLPASSPSPTLEPKPVQKFRHTFYQNTNEAVVEILAKGLREEQVKVEIGVQSLKVVIDCPPNEPYIFQTRLNQKVMTEKCKYAILSTKVEIRLAKAESLPWSTLGFNESQVAVQAPVLAKPVVSSKLDYPSSSRKGNKDWDKLEAQMLKEEKDEKLEGDAALNKLFRDIYRNADEDTRRAMNKSFVESSGTVLSTNWKDVGKKYVEGSAPSGMEMKKWEM
ncbi:hypothetical protein L7F22_022487 [Adiantum nelumboides]|nr:hypothetical protein [Adiantum nelumboides]